MKTLIKIWNSKHLIWQGVINKLFKKDPIEVLYRERKAICMNCELVDRIGHSCVMPGTQPCCSDCGCSLGLKLRSPDSACTHPDGPKWKEVAL